MQLKVLLAKLVKTVNTLKFPIRILRRIHSNGHMCKYSYVHQRAQHAVRLAKQMLARQWRTVNDTISLVAKQRATVAVAAAVWVQSRS